MNELGQFDEKCCVHLDIFNNVDQISSETLITETYVRFLTLLRRNI